MAVRIRASNGRTWQGSTTAASTASAARNGKALGYRGLLIERRGCAGHSDVDRRVIVGVRDDRDCIRGRPAAGYKKISRPAAMSLPQQHGTVRARLADRKSVV